MDKSISNVFNTSGYSTFTEDTSSSNTSLNEGTSSSSAQTSSTASTGIQPPAHAISEWSSFLNLLKANVGVGILAMPLTVSYTGLWLGMVAIPAIGVLCIYCMYLLLLSNREVRSRLNRGPMNMEETNEAAFATGPESIQSWATGIGNFTRIFLIINQIGFCCVYFEFVAQNVYQVLRDILQIPNLTQVQCNFALLIPFILVSLVRYLKFITYLSMVSGTAQLTGIAIILYYCLRELNDTSTLPAVGKWQDFPLFFGSTLFTFEGIGAVLPIENDMKDSSNFGGPNGVLITGMTIVLCMYTGVGFYGYLQYGDKVLGSITLNLPPDEILAQSVKLLMAIAIFLSFTLQLHVAIQVIMKMWNSDKDTDKRRLLKEYGIRVSSVIFCVGMASVVPDLGLFISLVGAAGGSGICIILPVIVHLVTFWPNAGLPYFNIAQTVVIVTIGVAGFIAGTATSLAAIVEYFDQPSNSTL